MKVLVTGASGFIGRNLLLQIPDDWSVTALYNRSDDFPGFVECSGLQHVKAVQADLQVPDQIAHAATGHFDSCVFLAANGDPAVSVDRPAYDMQSNCLSVVQLLEQLEFSRFVYFSSGAVYDGIAGGVSPESPVAPDLPYAISKVAAESYLRHFEKRGRIERATAVRFFGAYGPHEPARKIYSRLVRQFAIERNPVFSIRGDGRNLIDAMYVDDAVRALMLVLESRSLPDVVDLACGQPLTLTDLVEQAAASFGLEADISYEGEVPEYIEFRSVDRSCRDALGFEPEIKLSDGLGHLHQYLERSDAGKGTD
jgi:nucleoside-diphosphate-sugar epimerase